MNSHKINLFAAKTFLSNAINKCYKHPANFINKYFSIHQGDFLLPCFLLGVLKLQQLCPCRGPLKILLEHITNRCYVQFYHFSWKKKHTNNLKYNKRKPPPPSAPKERGQRDTCSHCTCAQVASKRISGFCVRNLSVKRRLLIDLKPFHPITINVISDHKWLPPWQTMIVIALSNCSWMAA